MKKLLLVWLILININSYSQIRYYPLDGNGNEMINNQNGTMGTGTHTPTTTTDRFGNAGNALYFDGDDYIVIPVTGLTNNVFSVSAWISIDNYPGSGQHQNLLSIGTYTTTDQSFGVAVDQFGHGIYSAGYTTGAEYRIFENIVTPLNNWFFYVATFDYDYVRLYVNGVAVDSASTFGVFPQYGASPAAFIGARYPGYSHWRGKLMS